MNGKKQFLVFGEPVEVLVSTKEAKGAFAVVTQTCMPGGGPPPHVHLNEDEVFVVQEGEYEFFDGKGNWTRKGPGEIHYGLRGNCHTFRNCGQGQSTMMIIATPGNVDEYLEEISVIRMPEDAAKLMEISNRYGINFPGMG